VDSKRNELKVGIAVLVSLIILIGGIIWGKGYRLRVARYEIEVLFDNVAGLESGCNVLANGVVKGRVTKITLHEGRVTVSAAVDKSVTLYSDYHITIESPTVMAGKVLALYPGSQLPTADLSKPLAGETPLGMGEAVGIFQNISADFRTALHNLNELMVNLNTIVGDTVNQQHVSDLLTDASGTARTSNEWLRDNRDDLTEIVRRLKTTLDATELLVHTTEARLNTTLDGVDSTTAQITALSASLRTIADQVNREDGTLGKLLHDDELYQRLTQTLAQVDSLSQSLRTKGLKHRITFF
jgi:phospholipid/cholesterol/gamma-HCH transport system substrate-binding protein